MNYIQYCNFYCFYFFFSSRRRHTRYIGDWSSDVCSSDLSNQSNGARDFYSQTRREGTLPIGRAGNASATEPCESLAFALEKFAILDALHKLHLDFGFLVRNVAGGFRRNDQR